MRIESQLILSPKEATDTKLIIAAAAKKENINPADVKTLRIIRQSIDARGRTVKVNILVHLFMHEVAPKLELFPLNYKYIGDRERVIIVGGGPAGLFAALRLIELGYCPVVLERGKNVRERKKDIALINRNKTLVIDSNYCFGEGGAGTFSDGKLYTRSRKRGNIQGIFEKFYYHGANEDILYQAHPHIGSDKLPLIVENMRKTITECGGEVVFEAKVTDFQIENDAIKGVVTADGTLYKSDAVVLATGHSARDIYILLERLGIEIAPKGFAMGIRIEHPQALIDKIQYRRGRNEYLPAATYSLVTQIEERGVYSFCMCPGGHIVPAGHTPQSIVVNGMSASRRNSTYANSGIVVETHIEDIPKEYAQYGNLAGMKYQEYLENLCFLNNGGKGIVAPAQRMKDFVDGRLSADLPDCSYLPGLISSPLHFWLPEHISQRLRKAFVAFDKKMRGYLTNDAVVVGVETRSSSPVRILREADTLQHIRIKGLFPAGEGAGYSGGISSSAVDGENAAESVVKWLEVKKNDD